MSLLPTVGAIDQDTGFYNGVATQSLRLDGGTEITLDNSGAATSNKIATFSVWFKRADELSTLAYLFHSKNSGSFGDGSNGNASFSITLDADDNISVVQYNGNTSFNANQYDFGVKTSGRIFRDMSSWYHLVVAIDTTQGSGTTNEADRIKMYINGTQQTVVAINDGSGYQDFADEDQLIAVNQAGEQRWGGSVDDSSYAHVYLAETNVVDGLQLDASYFGETKNGVWIAKNPSVSNYGNHGYRLEFKETGVGAGADDTVGADTSGKNNHFTTHSNIAAYDCNLPDSPENNFATMCPLIPFQSYNSNSVTYSNGSLSVTHSGRAYAYMASTFGVKTGKWYAEMRWNTNSAGEVHMVGISESNMEKYFTGDENDPHNTAGTAWYISDGGHYFDGSYAGSLGNAWGAHNNATPGFVIGVYIDLDSSTKTVKFNIDGANEVSKNLTANFSDHIVFANNTYSGTGGGTKNWTWNFGQDSTFGGLETAATNTDGNGHGNFHSAVPSGYLALCSANLEDDNYATIGPTSGTDEQAANYFDVFKYTGTGNDNLDVPDQNATITVSNQGLGFKPDMVMTLRNDGGHHKFLTDSTRGGGYNFFMTSNSTHNADVAGDGTPYSIKQFNAPTDSNPATNGGYRLGTSTNFNQVADYFSPCWRANGGTASTISVDSISSGVPSVASTVQVNTTAGFSIVQATSPSSGTWSVAHGLGVKPKWVILKYIANSSRWTVFFDGFTSGQYLEMNGTGGVASSGTPFNFTVTDTIIGGNANYDSTSTVAMYYCFAEIEGFSKIGTFQGNSDPNGPFVYTGFRPQMIIAKSQGSGNWHTVSPVFDHEPNNENVPINPLGYFNLSDTASSTGNYQNYAHYDFLSNGFKVRDNGSESNATGLFNYYAVATAPFKYSNAT